MNQDKSKPTLQQQQPQQHGDMSQQQSGSTEFQQRPGAQQGQQGGQQQMGEGSYEGTREYQKDIGEYMRNADIDKNAEAAKPRSESEARELEEAEREGKSHSKGEH